MTAWLPRYSRADLPGDLLAGAVVTALAVPQALGYAGIAGVPVQVGLYAIPLALLAYAVLGSSPHLVVGPVSTVSVLSGSLVAGLAQGDPARAVGLTSALAIAAGLALVVGGLAPHRLGRGVPVQADRDGLRVRPRAAHRHRRDPEPAGHAARVRATCSSAPGRC